MKRLYENQGLPQNCEGNKAGVIFVVIVLIALAGGLLLETNPPTIKAFSLPAVPAKGVEHYQNITLYACADGWDYGHGPINPTLVIPMNIKWKCPVTQYVPCTCALKGPADCIFCF